MDALASGDQTKVPRAVHVAAGYSDPQSEEVLLRLLRSTDDARIRNAAALALSDRRVPEAFDVIVDLLTDERAQQHRGSLVYALEPYDCRPIVPLLVDLVIEDGYEAACEAVSRLEEIEAVDEHVMTMCQEKLRAAIPAASPERRPILEYLLSDEEDCLSSEEHSA